MHPLLAAAVATSLIHDRLAASAADRPRPVRPDVPGPRLA
jgi:hypothetical protein